MIYFITGKPGSGKTLYTTSLIIDFCVKRPEYTICTNVPIKYGEIAEYMARKYPDVKFNINERIYLLTDEQCKEFWLYRGGITLPFAVTFEGKKEVRVVDYKNATRPMAYFIDECQLMFRPKDYAERGVEFETYVSQHRHFGDEIYCITQQIQYVDANFRGRAQDFTYMRNYSKEMVNRLFKAPNEFSRTVYLEPLYLNRTQEPVSEERFLLDLEICKCYDTSAGVGLPGGNLADTKGDTRRGFSNRVGLILLFLIVGGGSYGIWWAFTGGAKHVFNTLISAAVSKHVNIPGLLPKGAAAVGAVAASGSTAVVGAFVPSVKPPIDPTAWTREQMQPKSAESVKDVAKPADKPDMFEGMITLHRADAEAFVLRVSGWNIVEKILPIDDTRVWIRYDKKYDPIILQLDSPTDQVYCTLQIHSFQKGKDWSFDLQALDLGAATTKTLVGGASAVLNLGKLIVDFGKNNVHYLQTDTYTFRVLKNVPVMFTRGVEMPIISTVVNQGVTQTQTTYKPVLNSFKFVPRMSGGDVQLDMEISLQNILDAKTLSIATTSYHNTELLKVGQSKILLDLSEKLTSKNTGLFNWSYQDKDIQYVVTMFLADAAQPAVAAPGGGAPLGVPAAQQAERAKAR